MSAYMNELGSKLVNGKHGLSLETHIGENELLVELTLGNRKQSVGVSLGVCKSINEPLLRLRSRACTAQDHKAVRAALVANGSLELGSLCLDVSTNPP